MQVAPHQVPAIVCPPRGAAPVCPHLAVKQVQVAARRLTGAAELSGSWAGTRGEQKSTLAQEKARQLDWEAPQARAQDKPSPCFSKR